MICPKCQYEQEDRLECTKCGVVISKYYALYPSSRFNDSNSEGDWSTQQLSEQDDGMIISDLQIQLRDLNSRFADIEFERAERIQLRSDLKNLEKKLQDNLEQMAIRMEQCEKRVEDFPVSQSQQEPLESHLAPLLKRLDHVESILEKSSPVYSSGSEQQILDMLTRFEPCIIEMENKTAKLMEEVGLKESQINGLSEKYDHAEHQFSQVQDQLAALHDEVLEIKGRLDLLQQARSIEEPRTVLEDDVHAIRQNLDEFRLFMNALTKK